MNWELFGIAMTVVLTVYAIALNWMIARYRKLANTLQTTADMWQALYLKASAQLPVDPTPRRSRFDAAGMS